MSADIGFVRLFCLLIVVSVSVAVLPVRAHAQNEITPEAIRTAIDELEKLVGEAKGAKIQTLYAEIPIVTGKRFLDVEWANAKIADKRADWARFLVRNIAFEKARLKEMIAGQPNDRLVPPIPDYKKFKKKGCYFYIDGKPQLIITNRNSGGQKGDPRYCGPGTLYGIVSAVGASRYNYDKTPIWTLYQKDPKSHRVYDGGWCGHIIKDKWSIGGAGDGKGICIISLDYPPMLEAVRKSIIMYADRWKRGWRKDAVIVSMDWEFTYQNYDEHSKLKWQKWLKELYGTIDKLNKCWKTNIASFEEVTLPSISWNRERNPAKYYDFSEFNLWRFTDYLLWARKVVEKECPGYPITVGGGSPFGSGFAKQGLDEEYLRARGVVDIFLSETGSRSWGTASVFDLQHSMDPTVMIHDPEYHSTGGYVSLMFLHGASSVDFYNWKDKGINKSLVDAYALLRGCLDVRRMPAEIIQFPKEVPQVAVFYSRASLIQRHPGTFTMKGRRGTQSPYTMEIEKVYRAGTILDTQIGFVTTRLARLGIRKDLKVLAVPGAYFVKEAAAKSIMTFAKAGGTVLITPTSMVADEYNRRRDYLDDLGVEIAEEIVPRYLSKKAKAGVAMPGSEYDFIQGPIAPTVVKDNPTATITWQSTARAAQKTLDGKGIQQQIKVAGRHTVLATYSDGKPAVVSIKTGRGEVIYLAMQLTDESMSDLFDYTCERAGVERLVRTSDPDGKRIPGLDSRTVRSGRDYLTYLYNMTEKTAHVKLHPKVRVGRVFNVSLAQPAKVTDTFEVGPYEYYILKLSR